MTIPLAAPSTFQLLWNNFVLASESSSGFCRGISHYFTATRNTTEGVGEKEQTINELYGLGSTQSARRVVLWLFIRCASVDYRWRIVFAKYLQGYKKCQLILTGLRSLLTVVDSGLWTHLVCLPYCLWTLSHPTSLFCCSLSTAPLRHPSPTPLSGFLFPTPFSGVPLPTSGLVEDLELRPLFGFAPKQTKGSSAWRTTHIVSHI